MNAFNLFDLLAIPRREDPHDRILGWLCDPNGSHGLQNVAARMVSQLWKVAFDLPVQKLKRQYQMRHDCFPDLGIEFNEALMLIENKVNTGALREGQLQLQHELGTARGAKQFFHVLLCPDRMPVSGLSPETDAFRILRYSELAELLRAILDDVQDAESRMFLRHYIQFIQQTLTGPAPRGVRIASGAAIARRNTPSQAWSQERFMEQVIEQGSADFEKMHTEFLDLLQSMEDVEPRFDAAGPTSATYKVYLAGTDMHVLWVYADGRLYVTWKPLSVGGHADAAEVWKQLWAGRIRASNKNDCFADGGLAVAGIPDTLRRLQSLADFMKGQRTGGLK